MNLFKDASNELFKRTTVDTLLAAAGNVAAQDREAKRLSQLALNLATQKTLQETQIAETNKRSKYKVLSI